MLLIVFSIYKKKAQTIGFATRQKANKETKMKTRKL